MPAPATPNTPVHLFLAVAGVLATKTFAFPAGMIEVINTGTDPCWITLDGAVPVASDGDGQTQLPAGGPALNMTNTNVTVLKAINVAGKSSSLQIVIQQSSDPSGAMS